MSTACYDRRPSSPRDPIRVAGDLVRKGGALNIEAANTIKQLLDERKANMILFAATIAGRELVVYDKDILSISHRDRVESYHDAASRCWRYRLVRDGQERATG